LALHVTLGHSLRWFCVRQTVPAWPGLIAHVKHQALQRVPR